MTHHYHIPSAPLSQFISGFVYYKGYRPIHSIDRYLPNGNIELVIDLTEDAKFIYDNNGDGKVDDEYYGMQKKFK